MFRVDGEGFEVFVADSGGRGGDGGLLVRPVTPFLPITAPDSGVHTGSAPYFETSHPDPPLCCAHRGRRPGLTHDHKSAHQQTKRQEYDSDVLPHRLHLFRVGGTMLVGNGDEDGTDGGLRS